MAPTDLIAVLPKNYRAIALEAISMAKRPVVLLDKKIVSDYTETGPLNQHNISQCINFEIRDGSTTMVGFHDHPNEMWISQEFAMLATVCCENGWLKIQCSTP